MAESWDQSALICHTSSCWSLITIDIPQELILVPIQFNISINDLDDGAECTLSKFDTKIGVANTLEGHTAVQRNLNRLEELLDWKLMKITFKGMCKVLCLGRNKSMYQFILGTN